MKVTPYVINKGTSSEFWGLKTVEDDPRDSQVLPYTPEWKSKKSAIRYAEKHGMEVVESSSKASRKFVVSATNVSCSDLTDEEAGTLYELSTFAEKVIHDIEKDYGKKLSSDGWGEVMNYAEEITKRPEMYRMTGTGIDSAKLHLESVIYDIYEDDTGIKGIYESTSIRSDTRVRKFTIKAARDSSWRTFDVTSNDKTMDIDAPNFSAAARQVADWSDHGKKGNTITVKDRRSGDTKTFEVVRKGAVHEVKAATSVRAARGSKIEDWGDGPVKVFWKSGKWSIIMDGYGLGITDGWGVERPIIYTHKNPPTVAYDGTTVSVPPYVKRKFEELVRKGVLKNRSDLYDSGEWDTYFNASTSTKRKFIIEASATAKRKAAIKAASDTPHLFIGNPEQHLGSQVYVKLRGEYIDGRLIQFTNAFPNKYKVKCSDGKVRTVDKIYVYDAKDGSVESAKSIKCATDPADTSEYNLYGYDKEGSDVDTRYTRSAKGITEAVDELFGYDEVDTVDIYSGGMSDEGDYVGTVTRDEYDNDVAARVRELLDADGIKGAKSVKCATVTASAWDDYTMTIITPSGRTDTTTGRVGNFDMLPRSQMTWYSAGTRFEVTNSAGETRVFEKVATDDAVGGYADLVEVDAAESVMCLTDPITDRFMVDLMYGPNGGYAQDIYTDDWSEVESFAHDGLMRGFYARIWDKQTGETITISPDEYAEAWENGAADFDINEDIVRFKEKIVNGSHSVKCFEEITCSDNSDLTVDISNLELGEPYYEHREDDPENPDKWVLVIGKNPTERKNYKLWYYVEDPDTDITTLELTNPDHIDLDEMSTMEDYDDIQLAADVKCAADDLVIL